MMQPFILFCLPHPVYGGAERLVTTLMQNLKLHDVGCRLAILSHKRSVHTSLDEWFSPFFQTYPLYEYSDPLHELLQIINGNDISTLVICGLSPVFAMLPHLKAARPEIRIVSFQFNAIESLAENRTYSAWIDQIIVESLDAAKALTAHSESRMAFTVISSAIDVQAIAARHIRPREAGNVCVGYIGRYDRAKNPEGFVRMVAALPDRNLRLVMAGSGQRFRKTQQLIRQLGLSDRIEQKGLLSDAMLQALLDEVDILVVPSDVDGRPLMIQEAQARKIAVVATRVGGIPELIEDKVTGLLCAAGDYAALAAAVTHLARHETERHKLTEAAFERVVAYGDIRHALPKYRSAILGHDLIQPLSV